MPPCDTLTGNFQDNTAWTIAGKYVYDFGGDRKGEKLTLFAGYQHIVTSNPGDPININASNTTIGGYELFFASNAAANQVFTTDKILQVEWVGAKYELPSGWSFMGAYYHLSQDAFTRLGVICAAGTPPATGVATVSNCAGDTNTASFFVDYAFNKHFDIYVGVTYSDVSGGLASGFLATGSTLFTTGTRLKF